MSQADSTVIPNSPYLEISFPVDVGERLVFYKVNPVRYVLGAQVYVRNQPLDLTRSSLMFRLDVGTIFPSIPSNYSWLYNHYPPRFFRDWRIPPEDAENFFEREVSWGWKQIRESDRVYRFEYTGERKELGTNSPLEIFLLPPPLASDYPFEGSNSYIGTILTEFRCVGMSVRKEVEAYGQHS